MKMMKRITAVLIAALMCPLSFAAAVSAESETAPIVSAESSYNNVAGGFTFVEEAGDEAALSAKLSGEVVPGAFIFYPDKSLALYDSAHGALGYSLERALTLLGSSSRPVVYVTDEETAGAAASFFMNKGVSDFFFMSDSLELLAKAKGFYPASGAIADYRKAFDSVPDREKLSEIVTEMNIASASVALFADGCVTPETARYLYGHFILSWVNTAGEIDEAEALNVILSGAFAAVSDSTDILYRAATDDIMPNTVTRFPLNIGHRGSPNHAQENSVESVLTADREGADVAEIDIYLTTDEVPVIHHDPMINGVDIEGIDFASLRSIADNIGKSVPTLAEIFDADADSDIEFFLEIKSAQTNTAKRIAEVIRQYKMESRCSIISFSADQLRFVKEAMPGISRSLLVGDWNDGDIFGTAVNLSMQVRSEGCGFDIKYVIRPSSFDEMVIEAHSRGVAVATWTFYNAQTLFEYTANGSMLLTTDIPDILGAFYRRLDVELISTEVGTGEAIEYKARIANTPGDTRKASKVEVTVPGAEGKFTPDSGSLTFTDPGEYTVYFNHTVDLDNDFQYALCSGPIRVSVFLKGDVNSDGRVGMLDIVTLIRYLFGWDVKISEKAADMNSDSNIGMADLVLLIRATV